MREPLSAYIKIFENRYAVFNDLLKTTKNLTDLHKRAVEPLGFAADAYRVQGVKFIHELGEAFE